MDEHNFFRMKSWLLKLNATEKNYENTVSQEEEICCQSTRPEHRKKKTGSQAASWLWNFNTLAMLNVAVA